MSLRTCAADGCKTRFKPYSIDQVYCSHRCGTRMRVRRKRDRDRCGGGDDGGGGKRQMALFSKPSVSAKRMKPPRPETAPLFAMTPNSMHEKHMGLEVVPISLPGTCYRTLPRRICRRRDLSYRWLR
jgi:hypothetical protein